MSMSPFERMLAPIAGADLLEEDDREDLLHRPVGD